MLKVFKVYNGYVGNDSVHVIVLAETEGLAAKLAEAVFREDAALHKYGESYYSKLWAEQVCSPEHPVSKVLS